MKKKRRKAKAVVAWGVLCHDGTLAFHFNLLPRLHPTRELASRDAAFMQTPDKAVRVRIVPVRPRR